MQITPENVSIEQIGGVEHTVIRKSFDAEYVRKELAKGNAVIAECETNYGNKIVLIHCFTGEPPMFGAMANEHENETRAGGYASDIAYYIRRTDFLCIVTILPPLPKHPTSDDAWLLYLYAAHGLFAYLKNAPYSGRFIGRHTDCWSVDGVGHGGGSIYTLSGKCEITHCVTESGERVEVAISDCRSERSERR